MGHYRRMTEARLRLETRRLKLRPVQPRDAAPTAALVTPDIAANLSTWPSPLSAEQALARIREAAALEAARSALNLAIVGRADHALMGWIGLARCGPRDARLGYWLGAPFRGRGLMKEAVAAVVPAGTEFLGVDEVVALVLEANRASIAVLETVGFVPAGREDYYFEVAAERRPCLRYIWRARRKGVPNPRQPD